MTDVLDTIKGKCIKGERVEVIEEMKRTLPEGVEAKRVMLEALISTMSMVGKKYSSGRIFSAVDDVRRSRHERGAAVF
jgi:methanogenic corrinoid protein MtbC1